MLCRYAVARCVRTPTNAPAPPVWPPRRRPSRRTFKQLLQLELVGERFASAGTSWSICPSVPPGRPGPGVGVKKINVRPYSPPAKLKTAGANPPTAILDTPDRAESKFALGGLAPAGTGYEQAVTSQTLVRARSARGIRARGIFLRKSLS